LTMRITITARHCDIAEDLRVRARARLERLSRVAARPHHLQLIFGAEHGRSTAELRLHTNRRQVHVATADGADHRSALDRAVAKVRRQLDKPPERRARASARGAR
jgi:ribosomal subunit interface protein